MGGMLLGSFGAGMLARIPIGFALAGASLITLYLMTTNDLAIGAQRIVAGIIPYPLLAVPLFILAGGLMNVGGISKRLLGLADAIVGRLTGGLAHTNILSSVFFGGLSGSSVADVSSLGRILIPAMKERNYTAAYAAGVTAASAIIAPILPPSITLILFGVVTGTSIGQLFFAGIVPAVIYMAVLMVTVLLTVKRRGFDQTSRATVDPREIGRTPKEDIPAFLPALWSAIPALMLPVLILVGIRGGIFTPTEAAGMAVAYSLLVGVFIYRELTPVKIYEAMKDSIGLIGLILLVMATAQLYSWALTSGGVPQSIAGALLELSGNPIVILLLINVLLLIVGMFIEANAAIIILIPILFPVAMELGIDPLHLGVVIVVNMGLGLVTPPVGLNLMLASEIAEVDIFEGIKGVWPFLVSGIAFLLLLTFVPALSTWLPGITF
ncbi:TRAP transporter large permease [Brachybacterium sacelli]|uniref:C4-dicarboxylate transporter DctM subunit n=1 Tax=Brachybacterium sacelli TaxID=173364 RepID=A0ABS4WYU9_9MICO|nr:TRAP transporter large permease [Brachybacterium sacelli]MBP2381377.1 C4-dicarboxylate transporter DctM subunit [Brachybacterium sacelli]